MSELLLDAYRIMQTIRAFEELVWDAYRRGDMPGLAHLSIGQEAVATGVCKSLNREDFIVSTHRGHGHCIAKGTALDKLMAEMLGKESGICRGRGGTMHFADMSLHNIGAMGIVGAGIGMGAGVALACQLDRSDRVVAAFCGDGAMNEGVVYEAMNLASIWSLPLIIVCENNQYGEYTATDAVTAGSYLSARAGALSITAHRVDGMDFESVYSASSDAVERARAGQGPSFIECETYRFSGHHVGDLERYRTKDEVERWRDRDPIARLGERLVSAGVDAARLDEIVEYARQSVDEAMSFALASAYPAAEDLEDYVYAD